MARKACNTKTHRECNMCHTVKPITEFSGDRTKPQGRQYRCKACDVKKVEGKNWRLHYGQTPKVYALRCVPTGEIYIGSTTMSLERRYSNHKTAAFAENRQSNVYHAMRCWDDDKYWTMDLLEECPHATCSEELRQREQAYIENYQPVLNTYNACKEEAA